MISDELKRFIGLDYDASAPAFAAFADRFVYRHLDAPLAEIVRGLPGPVLDVAGGTGALASQIGGRVALFDLSMGQLRNARSAPRVQGDAERLPFRDDAFAVAACAFGVNHLPRPLAAVREMARVAPVVALLTWARPDRPYPPKEAVRAVLERLAGRSRTETAAALDALTEAIGSKQAVARVLAAAGLEPEVRTVCAEVPWPGAEAFVDYRLSMITVANLVPDVAVARQEALVAISALPAASLVWRPRLVLGLGRRNAP